MIEDVIGGREPWHVETRDCRQVLAGVPDASVDCVVCDPPYPEIDRAYGRLTEAEWWDLMMDVCRHVRRVLKSRGSAVFVLQPNSRKVGSMRGWLWRFMLWVCEEWNMVQDVWWWNPAMLPNGGANSLGMLRASVKACVWVGLSSCYRDQEACLWEPNWSRIAAHAESRATRTQVLPSGNSVNYQRVAAATQRRGGSTPFNLLPFTNSDSQGGAGSFNHGAGTPLDLCLWWVRYICPPGGIVCDPFCGSGTVGIAARLQDRRFVGIEQVPEYADLSRHRIASTAPLCDAAARASHTPAAPTPGLFDAFGDAES